MANLQRWTLNYGAPELPLAISAKNSSYETEVVSLVHSLGQRYWESRGESAAWERQFPTGNPGRPQTVDLALFSQVDERETRIEFGFTAKSIKTLSKKLTEEARKLLSLGSNQEAGFKNIENYVVLWHESGATFRDNAFKKEMGLWKVLGDDSSVLLAVAGTPVFDSRPGHHRSLSVALFEIA